MDAKTDMLLFSTAKLSKEEAGLKKCKLVYRWLFIVVMRKRGYGWNDIGDVFGVSPHTVRRLHRVARQRLGPVVAKLVAEASEQSQANRTRSKFSGSTNLPGRRKKRQNHPR